jgi:hypothetical protein
LKAYGQSRFAIEHAQILQYLPRSKFQNEVPTLKEQTRDAHPPCDDKPSQHERRMHKILC